MINYICNIKLLKPYYMRWIEVKGSDIIYSKNAKWVLAIAEIKNNETNEVREYETHEILKEGNKYPSVFNWEQNNYACDTINKIKQ